MTKGNGTRSGLLWEVERILDELKQDNIQEMPILLMENVSEVHSNNNIKDFRLWIQKLESLGYTNFCEDLNAKDFGIPQNRVRTFMISIPKECMYYFPKKKKLESSLKDLYISNVDEKYFFKEKQINDIINWKAQQDPITTMINVNKTGIAPTVTTRSGDYTSGMVILPTKNYELATFDNKINVDSLTQYLSNFRFRKLIPKELFRLMGVKDEDFEKIKLNQTESSLYHLAGDSIVTTCLMGLFGKLLGINWQDKFKIEEWFDHLSK